MSQPSRRRSNRRTLRLGGIQTFLRIIGLLALLIGGVGIINTMQVLLRRRFLEIAMLKTQGYRQRNLLLMFGIETLLLGLFGGVIGALLGIGLSFVVQALVERAFYLTIPTIIDPLTVISGVGVGIATTLIFGLLPIVRTSAVRPLAVLRDMGTSGARTGVVKSVGLALLLSALFFLLALSILGNVAITLAVVLGAGAVLGLLTALFALIAWGISRWPIPNLRRVGIIAGAGSVPAHWAAAGAPLAWVWRAAAGARRHGRPGCRAASIRQSRDSTRDAQHWASARP